MVARTENRKRQPHHAILGGWFVCKEIKLLICKRVLQNLIILHECRKGC
jgi:hypothetical protein